jgi:hypothetical protein
LAKVLATAMPAGPAPTRIITCEFVALMLFFLEKVVEK